MTTFCRERFMTTMLPERIWAQAHTGSKHKATKAICLSLELYETAKFILNGTVINRTRFCRFPRQESVMETVTEVSLPGQRLHRLHNVGREHEVEGGQVLLHVPSVGSTGEREHSNSAGEGEHDLSGSGVGFCGEADDQGMAKDLGISCEKGKSLIDDLSLGAEPAHL